MTNASRISVLAAAVAVLPACLVSTDEYAPKTAAQCQPWEKPCGYKCVSVDDPATGCGNASCDPVDTSTDPSHCGACAHACVLGTTCTLAVCAAESLPRPNATELRGIVAWRGDLFWIETSVAPGGALIRWSATGPFAGGSGTFVASGFETRSGEPSTQHIATTASFLYVAGSSAASVPTHELAIWEIDPTSTTGSAASVFYSEAAAGARVDGIAATADGVYFTRADAPAVYFVKRGGVGGVSRTTSPATPRGLAASGSDVYYGYGGGGVASLARTDPTLVETIVSTVGAQPDRLAVLGSGATAQVFFASEVDASAELWTGTSLALLYGGSGPGTGLASRADIAADAEGAYFFDAKIGEIIEWRADGWVFPLARNVSPRGIAVSGGYVYWTDATSKAVMRVPK